MSAPDTDKKVWYLRHFDLFLSLTDDEIEEIADVLNAQSIPTGAELFHHKQREGIYLIKEGAVRLYSASEQRQMTLALLGPGRLLGLSSSFGDANPLIGATTLEPSYLCSATWPQMLQLVGHRSEVILKITQALIEQIYYAESWVKQVNASSPRVRLADLLLQLCHDFGEPVEDSQRIRFRLTQADLAHMLNVARETVNRSLAEFRRAGWISRREGLLVIDDPKALADVAQGEDIM